MCPNAKEDYQNKTETLNEIANAVLQCFLSSF